MRLFKRFRRWKELKQWIIDEKDEQKYGLVGHGMHLVLEKMEKMDQ